ncbi:hypothetical protein [Methanoculleus sp.]|uniref:hypothetical protein n=2 Tax=Methanoculleus sp. TaxID=90427 RepID=UPI0025E83C5A|nr:hypothetical protein [Methanoculleus sp.]
MSNFKENVAYWLVPQGFQAPVYNFMEECRQIFSSDNQGKALLKKNIALRETRKGERCFILATGPSIKRQNLKLLQNEICIAVSNFFVHPDYTIINPEYYCIAPYHLPITEGAWQKWMDEIEKNTGEAKLFFGISDKNRNEMHERFRKRDVYYLKFGGLWGRNTPRSIDISRMIPGPQSVSIMALYVALYLGFKEIYLLGCDHDWLLHVNKSVHFYPENNHAMVKSGYNEWFQGDLEGQFQDYVTLWRQYKCIREIASENDVQIFNATDGGLLDVFPRIEYESLFM